MLPFVNLFLLYVLIIGFDEIISNEDTTKSIIQEPCIPGKIYKNSCNNCQCYPDRTLVCSTMLCLDENLQSKVNDIIKDRSRIQIALISNATSTGFLELPDSQCKLGELYKDNCRLCFCTEKGTVICKPKHCNRREISETKPLEMVPSLTPEEFSLLPSLPDTSSSCSPGKTYRVNCNTCICLQNGDLICDQMLCLDYNYYNAKEAKNLNGQSCDVETQKCITCNCKKDKLSCKAVPDCIPDTRRSIHGRDGTPKPAIDLKKDVCEKGNNYMIDCNKCFCFEADNIRCTMKTCLKHSDTEFFVQKLKDLENSTDLL